MPISFHLQIREALILLNEIDVKYGFYTYIKKDKKKVNVILIKPQPTRVKWSHSSQHRYKVNFNGAIFKESNERGIGVVICDLEGMVIATLSHKVKTGHSVEMIEALATKRAILLAMEVGLFDVELEGDSKDHN